MNTKDSGWVALLRAIGPATHGLMSMSQLREACIDAGLEDVQTVLATGNVLFRSKRSEAALAAMFSRIIEDHGLDNLAFLRRPAELRAVLDANPFPKASKDRPNHTLVLFMASAPDAGGLKALKNYDGPEEIRVSGREAYIDYVNGVAGSKLMPSRLEKLLGQPGTARNWNTVRKLVEKAAD